MAVFGASAAAPARAVARTIVVTSGTAPTIAEIAPTLIRSPGAKAVLESTLSTRRVASSALALAFAVASSGRPAAPRAAARAEESATVTLIPLPAPPSARAVTLSSGAAVPRQSIVLVAFVAEDQRVT